MVKKIIFGVMALAIVATGVIAFRKLSYWERSVRIFNVNGQNQSFEGRMRGGPRSFDGAGEFRGRDDFRRPRGGEIPDSIRARFGSRGPRPEFMEGNRRDTLRGQFRRDDRGRFEGAAFGPGNGGDDHRGRGEFPGGKRVALRSVMWFLAVFAAFTAVTVYLDKALCLAGIGKRKNSQVN